jgi:hypothetical protein
MMALTPVIVPMYSLVSQSFAPFDEVLLPPVIEAAGATGCPIAAFVEAKFSHITFRDQGLVVFSCGQRVTAAAGEPRSCELNAYKKRVHHRSSQ